MPRPGVPDPYRTKARTEGYVARAVYKLKALDDKYHLLQAGQRVLDLGCSPGSWLQYLASRVGAGGLVVGVDVTPPAIEVAPPIHFVLGEVGGLDLDAVSAISASFDAVVSDMAPRTTGIRDVDQQRSLDLALNAWEWARKLLRPGGFFLVKVFEGPGVEALVRELSAAFRSCRRVKPPGSRAASKEIYLLALNRRAEVVKGRK
ncbi:MAG: RlmE family RNA methyltransferase [Deltaproteobacteria bacterium]|nr:RlmE family RNA methyltransferase [Deltaproteobacteria bacterium]